LVFKIVLVTPVIERFVVVACPVIVVEARATTPPDWMRPAFKVVAPVTVRVLVTLSVPPIMKLFAWVMVVPEDRKG
jgi:hypothetical protein